MSLSAAAIHAALVRDDPTLQGQLDLRVDDGVVFLRGTVSSQARVDEIEWRVKAVSEGAPVLNLLRLDAALFPKEIEAALVAGDPALRGRISVDHVVIDDGLFLYGSTASPAILPRVERQIRALPFPLVINYLQPPALPVGAIREALAKEALELATRVLITTGWDTVFWRHVIKVWSPLLDEQEAEAIPCRLRGIARALAPNVETVAPVYSGPFEAMLLGLPPEQWMPLFRRHALRDHVVRIHDASEYLSAIVAKAAEDHRATQAQADEFLQGLPQIVALPGGADLAYMAIALTAEQADQVVQAYRALPAGTAVSQQQRALYEAALTLHDLFGAARTAIDQHRARWAEAGQFGELVARVLRGLLKVQLLHTVRLAAARQDAQLMASAAGLVRTMLAIEGRARGWRLSRAVTAAAGKDKSARRRALNELVYESLPRALAGWQPSANRTADANLKRLKNAVARTIERETLEAKAVRLGDGLLALPADSEFLARHTAAEQLHSPDEMLALRARLQEANLPPGQRAIMEMVAEGRSSAAIVEALGVTVGTVKQQKHRARKRLREYYRHRSG